MKRIEKKANEIYKTLMLEADCSLSGTDCECIANLLIAKGYRKQSEVAREIFEHIEKLSSRKEMPITTIALFNTKEYAELKKKYTEGEI